ncbi:protein of unknown function [Lachnospiraceae bacterium]|nr:protein of unknown function [Lachnospiraceae bacterium]
MTLDSDNLLESILESLDRIDYIDLEDIPNIELYMDQVTTLMESHLSHSKRYPEDKILTKTMINNYAKNDLLPPPVRKKYSRKHVLMLIFIYYFKNILTINDIKKIMGPLAWDYFDKETGLRLEDIYDETAKFTTSQIDDLKEFVKEKFKASEEAARIAAEDGGDEDNQQFLQYFTLICALSFDAYIKRLMIEKIIDLMPEPAPLKKRKKDKD